MPFEDYFHAVVMMTSMCGGQAGAGGGGKDSPLAGSWFWQCLRGAGGLSIVCFSGCCLHQKSGQP